MVGQWDTSSIHFYTILKTCFYFFGSVINLSRTCPCLSPRKNPPESLVSVLTSKNQLYTYSKWFYFRRNCMAYPELDLLLSSPKRFPMTHNRCHSFLINFSKKKSNEVEPRRSTKKIDRQLASFTP